MGKAAVYPSNKDPRNKTGRIGRFGTQAGISIATEGTSGGEGPIPPEGVRIDQKKDDKRR